MLVAGAALGLSMVLPTKDMCLSRKDVAAVIAAEFDGLAFETFIIIGIKMCFLYDVKVTVHYM